MDQQTRAALKQNDAFVTTTAHGLEWTGQNRRSVIVTSAILLAVIVLAVIAGVIYNSRSEAASVAFGAAMQAYQTPLATSGQAVPRGIKTYNSVAERAKAANDLFLQTAQRYSLTPDGKNSRYFAGLTYMEAGQNASAESTLKQVASGWNRDLSGLARLSLAQLYMQTGRSQQAIDLLNELTSRPSNSVPAGTAQLQLADLYQSQNNTAAARKILAQLKDKDPKGPAGIIAAQKLNPQAPAGPPAQ